MIHPNFYLILSQQVLHWVDCGVHFVNGEEGSQISGIAAQHKKDKHPPRGSNQTRWQFLKIYRVSQKKGDLRLNAPRALQKWATDKSWVIFEKFWKFPVQWAQKLCTFTQNCLRYKGSKLVTLIIKYCIWASKSKINCHKVELVSYYHHLTPDGSKRHFWVFKRVKFNS